MNERTALPWVPALMLSGICFITSFAALVLMCFAAVQLLEHAHPRMVLPDDFDGVPPGGGGPVAHFILFSIFGAMAFSGFILRATQVRVAAKVLFQTSFLIGFSLLAYSLWALLVLYRVLSFASSQMLVVTLTTTPFICGFVVPLALVFLTYAAFQEQRAGAPR